MKITVECDDGRTETYQHVESAYVMVSSQVAKESDDKLVWVLEARSYSWGELREIAKELAQSLVEIQRRLERADSATV